MKHRIQALREEMRRHARFLDSDELPIADANANVSDDHIIETAALVIERMATTIADMESDIRALENMDNEGPR